MRTQQGNLKKFSDVFYRVTKNPSTLKPISMPVNAAFNAAFTQALQGIKLPPSALFEADFERHLAGRKTADQAATAASAPIQMAAPLIYHGRKAGEAESVANVLNTARAKRLATDIIISHVKTKVKADTERVAAASSVAADSGISPSAFGAFAVQHAAAAKAGADAADAAAAAAAAADSASSASVSCSASASSGSASSWSGSSRSARPSKSSPPPPAYAAAPGFLVGAHVSAAGGVHHAVANAAALGCRAFALDLRNKRRWVSPPLDPAHAQQFRELLAHHGFSPDAVLPHGSYLVNLGSPDPEVRAKSLATVIDEVRRCDALGITLYNFHPGSSVGKITREESIAHIADGINAVHAATPGSRVVCVLENTAGGGSSIGASFADLRAIIDLVSDKTRVGVCLDTCHLFAAGHDITTQCKFAAALERFDRAVGREYLRAFHVNDSVHGLGERRDRHANVGLGLIGLEPFRYLMNSAEFRGIPLILETPADVRGDAEEVAHLCALATPEGEEEARVAKAAAKAAVDAEEAADGGGAGRGARVLKPAPAKRKDKARAKGPTAAAAQAATATEAVAEAEAEAEAEAVAATAAPASSVAPAAASERAAKPAAKAKAKPAAKRAAASAAVLVATSAAEYAAVEPAAAPKTAAAAPKHAASTVSKGTAAAKPAPAMKGRSKPGAPLVAAAAVKPAVKAGAHKSVATIAGLSRSRGPVEASLQASGAVDEEKEFSMVPEIEASPALPAHQALLFKKPAPRASKRSKFCLLPQV
jgi:AP endonuclease-1